MRSIGKTGFWEGVAEQRTWGRHISSIEQRLVDETLTLAGKPGLMLEIGAETGRWSARFARNGWSIHAIDVDAASLAECQRRLPAAQCTVVEPSATTLPARDQSVDAVVCMEVAPVMNSGWLAGELERVLRPGGLMVGTFWNAQSWRAVVEQLRFRGPDAFQWYQHPYINWKQDMTGRGFRFLTEVGYGWAPFSRDSNSWLVPAAVAIEQTIPMHRMTRWSPSVGFIVQFDEQLPLQ